MNGSMITAKRHRRIITRSSSFFKNVDSPNLKKTKFADYDNFDNLSCDIVQNNDRRQNALPNSEDVVENEAANTVPIVNHPHTNANTELRRNPLRNTNRPEYLRADIEER